jgi:2-aminoethylphosphonate transport system ATP-binding protein
MGETTLTAVAGFAPPHRKADAASGISFDSVTVAYGASIALDTLQLQVRPGEIMAIIGPSGCGKTTALRAVAGFVRPTAGRIRIGQTDVTDLPPHARDIGMVVQNYALFPHMKVADNVAFGLRVRHQPVATIKTRVLDCLAMVGMADFAQRYPRQLSGGQQQRVAIARALAIRPKVLLLDEPLSALDAQMRHAMLDELARLHRELPSLTVLFVTHDQVEALTLANRIAVMRGGKLQAEGPSHALYRAPPTRFTAEFLGNANLLEVAVERQAEPGGVAQVRMGDRLLTAMQPHSGIGARALLCVRPHQVMLQPTPGDSNKLSGTVKTLRWQGDLHRVEVDVQGQQLYSVSSNLREPPQPGTLVSLSFATDDATLIPFEVSA